MIRLETTFAGQIVQLHRERWKRYLSFAGGMVSRESPVVIRCTRATRRVNKLFGQLDRYGYKVRLVIDKPKED